ncbi:MAG: alpha/beta fold hydrolase [Catalinimonas sp.]
MSCSVTYCGHRIYVETAGEGETVVFVHGWPTNGQLWGPQVEALRRSYRVVTFDGLGFGRSDKPRDHRYGFESASEVLSAVVDAVLPEGEPLTLVAHDIGGPAAVLWAHAHRSRLRRLILLNAPLYPFSTPLDKVGRVSHRLPGVRTLSVTDFGLRSLMSAVGRNRSAAARAHINNILATHRDWGSAVRLKTIVEPLQTDLFDTLEAKLLSFGGPTHLIIARRDPLCYAHMRQLTERHPNLPARYLGDCGHFMAVDRPGELSEALLKVLGEE